MNFMNTFLFYALIALLAYSLYLAIKTLRALYKEGEKRLVYTSIAAWPLGAVLIFLGILMPDRFVNIWTGLPFVVLVFMWILFGFFIESFYRNRAKELEMGIYGQATKEATLQKRYRFLAVFFAGLIIWVAGFVMALTNQTIDQVLEYVLLCASMLLIGIGLRGVWRNRKIEVKNKSKKQR